MAVKMLQWTYSSDINLISYLRRGLLEAFKASGGESGGLKERVREVRRKALKEIRESSSRQAVTGLLVEAKTYMDEVVDGYREAGYEVLVDTTLKVKSRLVVGTGDPRLKGLLEVGLSWDPLLNLPYIPASSIKGTLLSAAKELGISVRAFGSKEDASELVFLDSYPVDCEKRLLDIDIINPHYREINDRIREVDVSPTPIHFLAVARGTKFRFVILRAKRRRTINQEEMMNVLKYAIEIGFGAKTSLAYGRFELELTA
jgi:CRISPR-associated protein Cmr6